MGGLPDFVDFKDIVEPLRNLFKDEVRKVGLELGLPEYLVYRQPFPGPGLGIRIIGEVTAEKVRIVQDADAIYREEIDKAAASYKAENGKEAGCQTSTSQPLPICVLSVLWVMSVLTTTPLQSVQSAR